MVSACSFFSCFLSSELEENVAEHKVQTNPLISCSFFSWLFRLLSLTKILSQLRHLKYSSQCLDCKCLANFSFLNIFSQVVHLTQKLAAFNECFFFRCLLKLCSWLYIVEHFGQPNLPLLSVLSSFSPDFSYIFVNCLFFRSRNFLPYTDSYIEANELRPTKWGQRVEANEFRLTYWWWDS